MKRRHGFLSQHPVRNGLLATGVLLIVAGIFLPGGKTSSPTENPATDVALSIDQAPIQPTTFATAAIEEELAPRPDWRHQMVKRGDNLAAVFQRAGLTPRDVHDVVTSSDEAAGLTRIYPGDELALAFTDDNELLAVRYEKSETETLLVERDDADSEFQSRIEVRELESRIAVTDGQINVSLYGSGLRAGLDDRLIMELARIFGWDIDFALDIRRNDRFTVVYEELYRDGEKVRTGRIMAAEFINRGERFRALRFEDGDGRSDFYTPDGRNMRRAFLRTPTDFTRVSSEFNPNRVHPVYGTARPHVGTDYAAPPGTPIWASGDGRIIHRGPKGGYGNTVVLQHGGNITTLYAHMRNFASGQSTGDRVQQGDVIGYVGSTGVSTGPHLHYEFRVDGVHRNPRTVELPAADPIDERYLAEFKAGTAEWVAMLDEVSETRIARAGD